jgi:hypothetical protein
MTKELFLFNVAAGSTLTAVFVGNLSWITNSEQLFGFLYQSTPVVSAVVQRYEDTNRSKGWG